MYASCNGINIYYETMGKGRALVMVHGNGETHQIFDKAAERLINDFCVYLPDTRSHGASSTVDKLSYDDMAEDIKCFVEEMHLENPVFYGFSDGGIVGIILAIKYPHLFSSYIISGANLTPYGLKKRYRFLFGLLYFLKKDDKLHLMLTQPQIKPCDLNKICDQFYVLCGEHDLISDDETARIRDNIPKAKTKVFIGHSHSSYVVHCDIIADYLLAIKDDL